VSWIRAIVGTYRVIQMMRGRRAVTVGTLRMLVRLCEFGEQQQYGLAALFGHEIVQRILDKRRQRRMTVWAVSGKVTA
jgi:hypothetical protein